MAVSAYVLTRVTPDGVEKKSEPARRIRDAAVRASRILADNVGTPKAEAQRFAAELARAPLGTMVAHPSGYRFSIDREMQ